MLQPLLKTFCQFLTQLSTLLANNLTIMFLGTFSKELKSYVHTKTYLWMFIAALFIIAKTWKQPTCPLVDERINKLWYIQTMGEYSVLKKKRAINPWKKHGGTLNVYLNQSKKLIYYMIPTLWYSGIAKALVTVKKNQWFPEVGGRRMNRRSTEDF